MCSPSAEPGSSDPGGAPTEPQEETAKFLFRLTEKELSDAYRQRESIRSLAKSTASLAVVLIAIPATAVLDGAKLGDNGARWVLLAALIAFISSIAFAALTIFGAGEGLQVSDEELDNCATAQFLEAQPTLLIPDFVKARTEMTKVARASNARAGLWLVRSALVAGTGLTLLSAAAALTVA